MIRFLVASLLAIHIPLSIVDAQEPPRELTPKEKATFDVLAGALARGDISPQLFASTVAHNFGSRALPDLVQSIKAHGGMREGCAAALRKLAERRGVLSRDSEKALIELLRTEEAGAVHAAWALGSICSAEALEALLVAAESRNKWVARAACMGLGVIGGEKNAETLARIQANAEFLDPVITQASRQSLLILKRLSRAQDKAALLELLSEQEPFPGCYPGWMQSPASIALRKIIQWDMRDLIPDLRKVYERRLERTAADPRRDGLSRRIQFAIYRLGGEIAQDVQETLRELAYLDAE